MDSKPLPPVQSGSPSSPSSQPLGVHNPTHQSSITRSLASTFRAGVSDLLSRTQFGRYFGLPGATYNGARNINESLGYLDQLSISNFRTRYERGGIAERIVEAYPRATWSSGADLIEDPDLDITTTFEASVREGLVTKLNLWEKLQRADILAQLGRYSVILLGADGDLSTELPRLGSIDKILYLLPLAEDRAKIKKLVESTSDPRLNLPEIYEVNLSSNPTISSGVPVHWSRIIHVAEGLLENDVYGKPRLRSVWNYLDDLDKLVGGGAEAAWKRMDPGMQLEMDPELEWEEGDKEALVDQISDYQHGLRRTLNTRGIKINQLTSQVAAFGSNADTVLKLISATTGIPHRILTGSEMGELASSQDRNNWSDRIQERRLSFAKPLVSQLIDRLIDRGALSKPTVYDILWPEIEELTEKEKADVTKVLADANLAQYKASGQQLVSADEIRDQVWGMEPLEVDEEEELEPPTKPDDEGQGVDEEIEDDELTVNSSSSLRASFDLTDSPPDEPDWRAVHRAADAHIRHLSNVITRSWTAAAESLDVGLLELAIARGDEESAYQLADDAIRVAENRMLALLPEKVHGVLVDGALATVRAARARGSWFRTNESRGLTVNTLPVVHSPLDGRNPNHKLGGRHEEALLDLSLSADLPRVETVTGPSILQAAPALSNHGSLSSSAQTQAAPLLPVLPGQVSRDVATLEIGKGSTLRVATFSVSFDSFNPRSLAFAAARSSQLVTEILPDTRLALRDLISSGIREGIAPRKLSQSVVQSIGLRTDQIQAIGNLRRQLQGARPDSIITRFPPREGIRDMAGFKVKVPKGGASAEWIERQISKYRGMQHKHRARTIARSETLRSANEGQRESWRQAKEQGQLPENQQRVWIDTGDERERDSHRYLSGQLRGIDEPFNKADGTPIEPGEEVMCRCTSGLAP